LSYKKVKNLIVPRSNVRSLLLKCYEEQMPKGWGEVKKKIRSRNKNKMYVWAIKHDNDPDTKDFWGNSKLKPHYHFVIKITAKGSLAMRTIANELGIVFREEDEEMMKHGGVETFKAENLANVVMYLTHETEQAILDGKTIYDKKKVISNMSFEETQQIREGYQRVSSANRKVSPAEMAELCERARALGRAFGDFEEWRDSLPYNVRINRGMNEAKKCYERGTEESIRALGTDITRLCVFIKGLPNEGKTYAAEQALKDKLSIMVKESGTGQFDEMHASVDALIIDDTCIPDLLAVADNRRTQVHKRNGGRPWWCGSYLIVTSNESFYDWVVECGASKSYDALLSRFYVCEVKKLGEKNFLFLESESTRGTEEDKAKRGEMFDEFRARFNSIIGTYKKSESKPQSRRLGFGTVSFVDEVNGRVGVRTAMRGSGKPPEPEEPPKPKEELWFDLGLVHKEDLPYYEAKGFVYSAEKERYENPKTKEYILIYEDVYFT